MLVYLAIAVTLLVAVDGTADGGRLRIKGGSTTIIQSRPYIVSIQTNEHECGGSIISKDIVLTAAHCDFSNIKGLKVRAGSSYSETKGVLHRVTKAIVHKDFKWQKSPTGFEKPINDIALLKVEPPFQFGDKIAVISMFNTNENTAPKSKAILSGWGEVPKAEKKTASKDDLQYNQLRSVYLNILDKKKCANDFAKDGILLGHGQICAYAVGKDACIGDSGGPLVVNEKLAGLVSWGDDCDDEDPDPGVYTEIAYFRKWIDENMRKLENPRNKPSRH